MYLFLYNRIKEVMKMGNQFDNFYLSNYYNKVLFVQDVNFK